MGGILAAVISGFLIGAAARWIVPGPDPMPFWLTVILGLVGSIAGGGIAAAFFGTSHVMTTSGHVFTTLLLEIGIATALVIAYRRFVQRRPVAGPAAHMRSRPEGSGSRVFVPASGRSASGPEQVRPRASSGDLQADPEEPDPAGELAKLRDLHAKEILDDAEFEAARRRLEER